MAPKKAIVADQDDPEKAEVENFLRAAGLGGFADKLIDAGIDTMPELIALKKEDCAGFGMGVAQQNRLKNALAKLPNGGAAAPVSPQANGVANGAAPKSMAFSKATLVRDHPPTESIRKHYDLVKKLGEGGMGAVYLARSKGTGAIRAVKGMRWVEFSEEEKTKFHNETDILRIVDHPNIVRMYETFQDKRLYYLVMEACEGGDLFDYLLEHYPGGYPEKQTAVIMKQLLGGIGYLHSSGIVHRDVKPENFLLKERRLGSPIKIADFGCACRWQKGQFLTESLGIPQYVAPEVLAGRYNNKCDIWSLGVVLYVLLSGFPPFAGDTDDQILDLVEMGRYEFPNPEWENVSKMAKDLVNHLMRKNPGTRIEASQALTHVWFENAPDEDELDENGATSLVAKLKSFQSSKELKKMALNVIATQISDKDIEKLQEVFQAMDKNGDGTIDKEELQEGLKAGLSAGLSAADVAALEGIDTDGTGKIDYTEFIAAAVDKSKFAQKDAAWGAFCSFDLNHDGVISKKELSMVLKMGGDTAKVVDREKVMAMLKEADLNGDGVVDFDEFLTMMKS